MKPRLKPIQEQVVVLMGATSGIGLETAKLMVEKGARVAIIGRSQEGLNEALDQIRAHMLDTWRAMEIRDEGGYTRMDFSVGESTSAYGGSSAAPVVTLEDQAIGLTADAVNFEQVKAAADQVVQRFGRIDTWVNLTGVSEWALFEDTSPDEFHRVIEVNLLGQSYGAMAALPYLKQQPSGALIFLSSVAGRASTPYQAAYNASKHGLEGLADTLRAELRYTRIPVSVTSILPASMNTPLFEKARTKMGYAPHPVPPVYEPVMVAHAIVYAAQHPVREMIVGDAGHMISFIQRIAPGLAANIMSSRSFRTAHTPVEKSAQAPDNLYQHLAGYDRAQGEFSDEMMTFNPLTWLSTHPMARRGIYATLLLGMGALIGWRVMAERNRRRSWRYRLPRMINRFSQQASQQAMDSSRQALKTSRVAWKEAQKAARASNRRSNMRMPWMQGPGVVGRGANFLLGFWAALTALVAPMLRDMLGMDARAMAQMRARMGKAMGKRVSRMSDQIKESRKQARMAAVEARKATREAQKVATQAAKSARKTAEAIQEKIPSKREIREIVKNGQIHA